MQLELLQPTPGQKRVREIIDQLLQQDPSFDHSRKDQDYIYDQLYDRLATDSVVTSDIITGSTIHHIEHNYLSNLTHQIKLTTKVSANPIIDYSKLITTGSETGSVYSKGRKIYQGGTTRPETTARALLTLGCGMHVGTETFKIEYYLKSQISIVSTGNHRALAYALYGVASFPDMVIRIYDDDMVDMIDYIAKYKPPSVNTIWF